MMPSSEGLPVSGQTPNVRSRVGNRLSRRVLTHMLDYTPHIPSICAAAASPKLRYARETIAGVRVRREAKHRGDLYLSRDPWTNHEYHELEGVLEHLVADLHYLGWWLGRRVGSREFDPPRSAPPACLPTASGLDSEGLAGEALRSPARYSSGMLACVVPLEVNVKRVANTHDTSAMSHDLRALLGLLARPPYQAIHNGAVISCLRSITLTPKQLPLSDPACLVALHALPLLSKLESFASDFVGLGPAPLPSLTTLRLRNTTMESLDGLRAQPLLRVLELSRCDHLVNIDALAALTELRTLSLSSTGRLSLTTLDLSGCTHLRTVTLTWCPHVEGVHRLLTAPQLTALDLSFSRVTGLTQLLEDAACNGEALVSLSLHGCDAARELLDALSASDEADIVGEKGIDPLPREHGPLVVAARGVEGESEGRGLGRGERSLPQQSLLQSQGQSGVPTWRTARSPRLLSRLRYVDLGECDVDDRQLRLLAHCCPQLRAVSVRECAAVRSLSALGRAPDLESVDASYTGVSDIAGLAHCTGLRCVKLRDCFRLRSMAPLTSIADSLVEVDASMAARTNTWSVRRDSGAVIAGDNLYSQELLTPLNHPPLEALGTSSNLENGRSAADRAALLELLNAPLQLPVLAEHR